MSCSSSLHSALFGTPHYGANAELGISAIPLPRTCWNGGGRCGLCRRSSATNARGPTARYTHLTPPAFDAVQAALHALMTDLSALGERTCQGHAARPRYRVPVQARSALFRGRVCALLRQECPELSMPASVWTTDWVVYGQPSVHGTAAVLRYLGRDYLPPRLHEHPASLPRRWPGVCALSGLPHPSLAHHDPPGARMHPPLPAARLAPRLPQGPGLWAGESGSPSSLASHTTRADASSPAPAPRCPGTGRSSC